MFGHRYFGARMFGPRYWGDGGGVTPVIVATPATGMGPGWNLFVPPHTKRTDRSADEIEAVVRDAYERATDTDTAQERKRGVVALKRVVAEASRQADAAGFAALAASLSELQRLHVNATRYLAAIEAILAKLRAEEDAKFAAINDDEEAFMLMMELI